MIVPPDRGGGNDHEFRCRSDGSPLWTLGGSYRFDLVRAGSGWKIAGLVTTVVWADGDKDLATLPAAAG